MVQWKFNYNEFLYFFTSTYTIPVQMVKLYGFDQTNTNLGHK